MKIAIINYGMGNQRSVVNAVEVLGHEALLASHPEILGQVGKVILPGVGAFGDAMRLLVEGGWREQLEREIRRDGKLFLGLCLGMQLLASTGTEHGLHEGFGWVPGTVERLPTEYGLRIPHMGWNEVQFTRQNGLYNHLGESAVFYFAHSYALHPKDATVVSGSCDYGMPFAASIESGNVFATQFHPEKSQRAGLAVLKNFLEMKS